MNNEDYKTFVKLNYDNIEIGKLYTHSEKYKEIFFDDLKKYSWGGSSRFYYFHHENNKNSDSITSVNFDLENNFIILKKELNISGRRINEVGVTYHILYDNKILNRYYYISNKNLSLGLISILRLIS